MLMSLLSIPRHELPKYAQEVQHLVAAAGTDRLSYHTSLVSIVTYVCTHSDEWVSTVALLLRDIDRAGALASDMSEHSTAFAAALPCITDKRLCSSIQIHHQPINCQLLPPTPPYCRSRHAI